LTRNRLLLLIKVIPLENLPQALLLTIVFDVAKLFLMRERGRASAMIRAYLNAFTNLRYAFSKRAFLQKLFTKALDDLKREEVFLRAEDILRGGLQFI